MPVFEITSPDGARYRVEGPPGATEQDALAQVQAQHGMAQASAADTGEGSSTMGDVTKSFGSGLVRGAAGLAGSLGDVAELGTQGINYLTGSNLQNKVPLATTDTVLKRLQDEYGLQLHKPEGTAGEYAQTLGSFVPGMLFPGGEASLARRAATNVIGPALASETAGQLTAGTPVEPYARIAGALGGGLAGARLGAARAAPVSAEEILAAGKAGYESPAVTGVTFNSDAVKQISDSIQNQLRAAPNKFNDANAKPVFDALEDLKTPVGPTPSINLPGAPAAFPGPTKLFGGRAPPPPGGPQVPASIALGGGAPTHSYQDFQALRSELSRIAGKYTEPTQQAAASKALNHLNDYLENVPQSHLGSGDAAAFGQAITDARHDYAAGKTLQRMQEAQRAAELGAASTNSGANLQNKTRQQLRKFITSAKGSRGFSDEEIEELGRTVVGSTPANVMRWLANVGGGGGGLGQLHAAALGAYMSGGNPMGLLGLAPGYALRKGGEIVQARSVNKVMEMIRQRSPSYQAYLETLPPQARAATVAQHAAVLAGLAAQPQQSPLGSRRAEAQ